MNGLPVVLQRRAALEDAPAILELQRQAYQSEALLYNNWSIPPLTQSLTQLRDEFPGAVAHIGRLMVAPAAQRRGLGSALLQEIERALPQVRRFELFTGSRSEGNIRLYRAQGYVLTYERVLAPSVTIVCMSKPNETAAAQPDR
jgi:GNAT superfamily N-acetyltransferase